MVRCTIEGHVLTLLTGELTKQFQLALKALPVTTLIYIFSRQTVTDKY